MSNEEILAVVVSFNGERTTVATINRLLQCVGHVLVVDNGSTRLSLDLLKQFSAKVTVIELGRNAGIGAALNVGVRFARERAFKWLLTMDQDSVLGNDFIEHYRIEVNENSDVLCLTPYVSINGLPSDDRLLASLDVEYAITSGNLVRLDLFEAVGMYDEALFIDSVDFDFSLRVREAGFRIVRVRRAVLAHAYGDKFKAPIWVRSFYSRHSPTRRYYIYRNFVHLLRRYWGRQKKFLIRLGILLMLELPLIVCFDLNRRRSLRYIVRGVVDGIRDKFGPVLEDTK